MPPVKQKHIIIAVLITALAFLNCSEKLPKLNRITSKPYALVNSENIGVEFPSNIRGKISVVGYIFTNCPDICPLTTNNMRLIKEKLQADEVSDINFVSISFDPETDTPEVLKKYSSIRNLDLTNWTFLTGTKPVIDSLMNDAEIFAVPSDSTVLKSGKKIFFYVHTDRIQLVDKEGFIRKNYPGSKINIDEIIMDIKKLSKE